MKIRTLLGAAAVVAMTVVSTSSSAFWNNGGGSGNNAPWNNSWAPWNWSNGGGGPWNNGSRNNGPWNNMPFRNGPWNNSPFNNGPWSGGGPWNNRGGNNAPWNSRWAPWNNGPWSSGNNFNSGFGPMDAMMNGDFDVEFSVRGSGNASGNGSGNLHPYASQHTYVAPVAPAPVVVAKVDTDGDKDGVTNLMDLCPDSALDADVDFTGCEKSQAIALDGVNFKTDSDELTAESSDILDRVARTLSSNPQVNVEVGGHTDAMGDAAYNLDLSDRRAKSVREYLVAHGVSSDAMTSQGYGQTLPVAGNDSKEGRAANRRVELKRLDQ